MMASWRAAVGLLCLSLCFAATAGAQVVDRGFAPQPDDVVNMVATHPDGVLVGGAFTSIDGLPQAGLARLDRSGHIAPGMQLTDFRYRAWTAAVLENGRMMVGGYVEKIDGVQRIGLARLNGNGTLDPSFADPQVHDFERVYCTAEQADGRILISGSFTSVGERPSHMSHAWMPTAASIPLSPRSWTIGPA